MDEEIGWIQVHARSVGSGVPGNGTKNHGINER